jgi:RimJ/RimL family protein N-acetyltransferase
MTSVAALTMPTVMTGIAQIPRNQPNRLKDLRLRALKDSPGCFLSTFDDELEFQKQRQWAREFDRGSWYAAVRGSDDIGLIGFTREPDMSLSEYYIEFMWVARESGNTNIRKHGVGEYMLLSRLDELRRTGLKRVYLWVLTGNDTAVRLYERVGFTLTGERQRVEGRRDCYERRMELSL